MIYGLSFDFCRFVISLFDKEDWNLLQRLPKQFCLKHIDKLQDSMELKLRNGYILPVQFDAVKCELKGVMWFFKELDLEGGEILLFEYFGRFKFMVYIIGRCGSEITYPEKVHCLQRCSTKIGYHMHKSSFTLCHFSYYIIFMYKNCCNCSNSGWWWMEIYFFPLCWFRNFWWCGTNPFLLCNYCCIRIMRNIISLLFRMLHQHSVIVVDLLYQRVLHMFWEMGRSFLAHTNPKNVASVVWIQCLRY